MKNKTERAKVAVVWIDRAHAKVFFFSGSGAPVIKKLTGRPQPDHHTHSRDAFDHERKEAGLFREASNAIEDSEKILVVGPGIAKFHFRNYLNGVGKTRLDDCD